MINERFDYQVGLDANYTQFCEMREWIKTQFEGGGYGESWDYSIWMDGVTQYIFYFANDTDYTLFLLRWS